MTPVCDGDDDEIIIFLVYRWPRRIVKYGLGRFQGYSQQLKKCKNSLTADDPLNIKITKRSAIHSYEQVNITLKCKHGIQQVNKAIKTYVSVQEEGRDATLGQRPCCY